MRRQVRLERLRGNKSKESKRVYRFDKTLLFLTILLLVLGLVAIADSSAPAARDRFGDSFYFVKQQLLWGGIGVMGMILATFIDYKFWRKLAPIILTAGLVSLVL